MVNEVNEATRPQNRKNIKTMALSNSRNIRGNMELSYASWGNGPYASNNGTEVLGHCNEIEESDLNGSLGIAVTLSSFGERRPRYEVGLRPLELQ